MESTTLRVARTKFLAGTAQQPDAPCARQVDMAWLGAVGAAGWSVDVGPKMGKARIKLFLVPEAGIEPAWAV